MTVLGEVALRLLARKVLTPQVGSAGGVEDLASAVRRTYDDLARVSIPLIGQLGVDALTGRAIHLAQREYPWLADARDAEPAPEPFAHVIVCLARQDPAIATEGAAAVFATYAGLLITFIGEPLTTGLLRKAWPDAFSTTPTEET
jgi:hypothetical protein